VRLFLKVVIGYVLGGVLGGGCGILFQATVGRSQWIRSNGVIYDLIATLSFTAPYLGLAAGAFAGAMLMARWSRAKNEPGKSGPPSPDRPAGAN